MKNKFIALITILIFTLVTILPTSAFATDQNNLNQYHTFDSYSLDKVSSNIDSLFSNSDNIKETKAGTIYYIDSQNSTVLKTIENNCIKLKITEEGFSDAIITIDEFNNIYLNGNKIQITYDELDSPNENIIKPLLNVRYYESNTGTPSQYTVLAKTEKIADINLKTEIAKLSATALFSVVKLLVPELNFTLEIASNILEAYIDTKTKHLSSIIKHYYKKGSPGGWYMGSFAEKLVTTWYSQKNYKGKKHVSIHYRHGMSF